MKLKRKLNNFLRQLSVFSGRGEGCYALVAVRTITKKE